jgi:outer membrane protein assembly factor BamB
VVFSNTATGTVIALDAGTGKQLWSYQCTPRLYVFSDPVADGERVYVTGMDGSVTALRTR